MRRSCFLILFAVWSSVVLNGQTVTDGVAAESQQATQEGTVRVKIHTRLGDIIVRLYDATPIHRDNFVKLVKEGYYDGTLFHRVIKDFMIQGGDPHSKGAPAGVLLGGGDPDYTLEAEFRSGLYHKRGALAAAREGDATNPERRSSGSQYYIVWGRRFSPRQLDFLSDKLLAEHPETGGLSARQREIYSIYGGTPHLDGMYTVFGEVEEGLDVVEKIQLCPTGASDRPVDDIDVQMTLLP